GPDRRTGADVLRDSAVVAGRAERVACGGTRRDGRRAAAWAGSIPGVDAPGFAAARRRPRRGVRRRSGDAAGYLDARSANRGRSFAALRGERRRCLGATAPAGDTD